MKKVIVLFANGTEECEALLVVDLLRRAGAQVTIAAVCDGDDNDNNITITSSHGITLLADANAKAIDLQDADMLVLPGGMPGTAHLAAAPYVLDAVRGYAAAGKWVAAICAAPSILGTLGLLDGRGATAHAAFQNKLGGATVLNAEVVVDGQFITSYGLGGAIPFALQLVATLFGAQTADEIKTAIAYRHTVE